MIVGLGCKVKASASCMFEVWRYSGDAACDKDDSISRCLRTIIDSHFTRCFN
jgi:hypothetical protein